MAGPDITTGKKVGDAEEASRACAAVEAELAELRAAYDQYFLGVERRPPTKQHEALRKQMRDLKNTFIRQTAIRFRIDNLGQKMTTFERLWDRTLKEIEAGTYKRHLFKARLHAKPAKPKAAEADRDHFDVDEDLDMSDFDADTSDDLASALAAATASVTTKPAAPATVQTAPQPAAAQTKTIPAVPAVAPVAPSTAAAAAAKTVPAVPGIKPLTNPVPAVGAVAPKSTTITPAFSPPKGVPAAGAASAGSAVRPVSASATPAPGAPGGLSDQKIKAIYDAYVMAKRRCGEDTSKISLTTVADTLKKQVPELMKQHQAKSVEFKVVIKDGKAVLRALPKE